jgi:hypothetical protein
MQKNTRWIVLYTAILLIIATAVAGAATATQDKNPSQAGHSPIYYFDVTYNGNLAGQVVINTANAKTPTYILVAQGLTPNTQYTFGYTASGVVNTLDSKDTTKAGALVMDGTFPAADVTDLESAQFWVIETPPGAGYTRINGFVLGNYYGWFVTKIACYYSTDGGVTWNESSHTGGIAQGHSAAVYLRDLGVPDGALVRIHAIVVGGKDRTGSEAFQCSWYACGLEYSEQYAEYNISGTTWNPVLSFDRIQDIVW